MLRLCLDLNIWCGAFLAQRLGRNSTAAGYLTQTLRDGVSPRGPVALVISLGMLDRLRDVLSGQLGFTSTDAERLCDLIATYAREGPSLTLGGIGVLPIRDQEDRHVLETAWAAHSDLLVTHNLVDFLDRDSEVLVSDRVYGLTRGTAKLLVCHTYNAAAWLGGERWPDAVIRFLDGDIQTSA